MLHVNWEPLLYTIGQSKQKVGMSGHHTHVITNYHGNVIVNPINL